MLVLTRKVGEVIRIGPKITVTVLERKGNHVRIGIEAPDYVKVWREELLGCAECGQAVEVDK